MSAGLNILVCHRDWLQLQKSVALRCSSFQPRYLTCGHCFLLTRCFQQHLRFLPRGRPLWGPAPWSSSLVQLPGPACIGCHAFCSLLQLYFVGHNSQRALLFSGPGIATSCHRDDCCVGSCGRHCAGLRCILIFLSLLALLCLVIGGLVTGIWIPPKIGSNIILDCLWITASRSILLQTVKPLLHAVRLCSVDVPDGAARFASKGFSSDRTLFLASSSAFVFGSQLMF